jgi:hypothetical protein
MTAQSTVLFQAHKLKFDTEAFAFFRNSLARDERPCDKILTENKFSSKQTPTAHTCAIFSVKTVKLFLFLAFSHRQIAQFFSVSPSLNYRDDEQERKSSKIEC